MKITSLELLPGLKLVELVVHGDQRGFFIERYNETKFKEAGLPHHFVQDNHSRSAPGVLRGLHYQVDPTQGKLVGVTRGRVWDVAVDIRPQSPTYGKSVGVELSGENGRMLWIPSGFAHGFCVLGNDFADMLYKVDGLYNSKGEGGIHWADPDLNIQWPPGDRIVSERDQKLPLFEVYRTNPARWT